MGEIHDKLIIRLPHLSAQALCETAPASASFCIFTHHVTHYCYYCCCCCYCCCCLLLL